MPDVTKLVNATELDSNLTSVANAIRAKSGGSGSLAFPGGFVSEIQSIPTGGGGTTKAGPSMFYLESYNGSYNIIVSYDATIGNTSCIDEDGNTYDGTNGKFQYAPWNGGNPNTWTDLSAGQTTKPANTIALRFVNTDNNKPFICCARNSEFTGNDVSTGLLVNGVSGNYRYGIVETKPVPDTISVSPSSLVDMYQASIGANFQFDWVITQEID